ncbi:acyl-CoA dehydrogenase family protein [Nocardia sp. NBC_01503]|uniref:acyl-CoA dehydrogenase family protein n=1 Tax=Nocardia sp. NBC_01503 TaxID=2975997 RepID=UPI002E7AD189|nr:acyl-CoA dehydrogenase family protein [Nocardia sp. NBC_01503]WTL31543.1 acyl-CoA dehydrogenase family protein [Nocardia sp. NBC_01503]
MSSIETGAPALFEFTAEHGELRAMLRRLFDRVVAEADERYCGSGSGGPTGSAPGSRAASIRSSGWRRVVHDAGIGELLFGTDQSLGPARESSGTAIDIAILAEESGAALYGGPLLSAAMIAALLEAGHEGCPAAPERSARTRTSAYPSPDSVARERAVTPPVPVARLYELASRLRDGTVRPSVAAGVLTEPAVTDGQAASKLKSGADAAWRGEYPGPARAVLTPTPTAQLAMHAGDALIYGADQRLSGRVEPIWDACEAAVLVCPAHDPASGERVVAVLSTGAPGITASVLDGLDLSRAVGRADCAAVAAELLLTGEFAQHALTAMRTRGELVLAAESLGLAQRALDRTVGYARGRVQFGRTIGSFQAVKHRLADLVSQVELTRSAVYGAAWALTTAPEEPATAIDLAVAAALAAETSVTAAEAAVQLHGGIAITWEHWAHRALRRAHTVAALTGGAGRYRRQLAELLDSREGGHDR